MNCGEKLPGRPSMGSWLTYGLGTENQNLPGFVVLCPGLPVVGPQLWSSTFLPAVYQGTYIPNNEKDAGQAHPVHPQHGASTRAQQRRQLDLLAKLNRLRPRAQPVPTRNSKPASNPPRSPSACRPKRPTRSTSRREPEATRARYGDSDFGRGCLIARRLVERGVRMVQVYFGNCQPWDNHDDIHDPPHAGGQTPTGPSRRCSTT